MFSRESNEIMSQTTKSPLEGSTVLVTGGAGLIGSHIVDRLVDRGAGEIRVLDNMVRGRMENLAEATARRPIRVIEGDVRDRSTVQRAVAGCDFVFHQAAIRITLCAELPRECVDVLVGGTLNVFEASAAAGVQKVVYASSASVYGGAETFPTNERHHSYNNRTLYGSAKLMDEGIARHFHDMEGLASVGLRYFNVYGPRMDYTGAQTEIFIRWLDCVDRRERPRIHGDGSASMDLIFVDDAARANILALESDRNDDVYNIASGVESTLLDLWRSLQEVTGALTLEPEFHLPRKENSVPRRLADVRKARDELGFETEVSLIEGLGKLRTWQRRATAAPGAAIP